MNSLSTPRRKSDLKYFRFQIRNDRTESCRAANTAAQHGLTLLEMIVVLVIIAVIAAMIVPNVIGRPGQARVTMAGTDMKTIAGALEMYRLDNGTYPTTSQGLAALVEEPTTSPRPDNWHSEGYLDRVPVDPWGNDYLYRSPGETGRFDLVSYGADGEQGGSGLDADLDSRDRVR